MNYRVEQASLLQGWDLVLEAKNIETTVLCLRMEVCLGSVVGKLAPMSNSTINAKHPAILSSHKRNPTVPAHGESMGSTLFSVSTVAAVI